MQHRCNLDVISLQFRCNSDAIYVQDRSDLDACIESFANLIRVGELILFRSGGWLVGWVGGEMEIKASLSQS